MNDLFFDTGVLLAAYDNTFAARQRAVRWTLDAALQAGRLVTSAQVLHEFAKLAVSGRLLTSDQALGVLNHLSRQRVVSIDAAMVLRAAQLQRRRALSSGDALVVQAALDAGCRVLYSESLPAGLCFDGAGGVPALWVADPMSPPAGPAVHESLASYKVQRRAALPQGLAAGA